MVIDISSFMVFVTRPEGHDEGQRGKAAPRFTRLKGPKKITLAHYGDDLSANVHELGIHKPSDANEVQIAKHTYGSNHIGAGDALLDTAKVLQRSVNEGLPSSPAEPLHFAQISLGLNDVKREANSPPSRFLI
ncbi:hypothetical protein [Rhodobacter aestuarii]|uniref:hypothetical protein n=1 Tax=Rhodobacter aestuarii TaxID=453582 RepID=UPI0011158785|nr:hypothetical protein [Rhodobacter aestuarii]